MRKIKRLNELIAVILTFLIVLQIGQFTNIKQAKAETKFAYLTIEHLDKDGNRLQIESRQEPLVGGKATSSFYLQDRPGYTYKTHVIQGATRSFDENKKLFNINLSSSNTYENPAKLNIIYEKTSGDVSISVKGYVTDKNGSNGNYFSTKKISAAIGRSKTVDEPEGVDKDWEFMGITLDGTDKGKGSRSITFTPTKDAEVIFKYRDKEEIGGPKDIRVVALAVGLDENNEVIRENGKWEFARTDNIVKTTVGGKVSISSPAIGSKPPKYKDFNYVYTWDDTQLTGEWNSSSQTITGGKKYTSESIQIPVKSNRDNYYVYFYYKEGTPPPPEEGGEGEIIFIPHETTWTNSGKTSNGNGSYPVTVKYTGSEVITKNASYTWTEMVEGTDSEGNATSTPVKHSGTFPVKWNFERIEVSGAETKTIRGMQGVVDIDQEGYHQSLSGIGYYGEAQYTVPSPCDGYSLPANPKNPTGKSGYYDLDWTDPVTSFNVKPKIFNEENGATRGESKKGIDQAYFGTLTTNDNLSGISSIDVGWTFGKNEGMCKYENIYSNPGTTSLRSDEVIQKQIEKPVGDDMYLHVKLLDIAGNTNYFVYGPYEDPIMLKDFKVTEIGDPEWDMVFWKDWEKALNKNNYVGDKFIFTEPTGAYYPVSKLPIDNNSHPQYQNYYTKRGYAFSFDLTSEYLYRDMDKIVITPTFYALDEKTNKRQEVDVYYQEGENPFNKLKSKDDKTEVTMRTDEIKGLKNGKVNIGSCSELTLVKGVRIDKGRHFYKYEDGWEGEIQYKDGKLQTWHGRYFIPDTATRVVPKGVSPRPENLIEDKPLLINFKITAIKNGVETNSTSQTFEYIPKQWNKEGGPKDKTKYQAGDVMLHHKKLTRQDDFETRVTH